MNWFLNLSFYSNFDKKVSNIFKGEKTIIQFSFLGLNWILLPNFDIGKYLSKNIIFDRQIHTSWKLGFITECENLLCLLDMSSGVYQMPILLYFQHLELWGLTPCKIIWIFWFKVWLLAEIMLYFQYFEVWGLTPCKTL